MAKKASRKGDEKAAEKAAISFEKELARLEETVDKLESEMPGLDESIKLYEAGVKSLKACQQRLSEAEGRIKMLIEGSDGEPETTEFDAEQAEEPEAGQAARTGRTRKPRPPKGTGLFG